MDRQEKKKWLRSYLDLKHQINALAREYEFWEEKSTSIPISRIEATGIHGSRKRNEPLTKHIDICIKINEMQEEAKTKLYEITTVINSVSNPEERSVLRYRYINGLYFYKIAKEMHFSLQHIYRLHDRGLDNLVIDERK